MRRSAMSRPSSARLAEPGEIVVVDASSGRLDYIRQRHEARAVARFPATARRAGIDPAPAECRGERGPR